MSTTDRPGLEALERVSLSARAVDAIRKGIAAGLWAGELPGQRRLCRIFQISRPTVSAALEQLRKEGAIEIRRGRNPRILAPRNRRGPPARRFVAIVAPEPLFRQPITVYHGISEMRLHLAERGFATAIFVCPPGPGQIRRVEALFRQHRPSACVLWSANHELQEWFAHRPLPTLVLGTCFPSFSFPSIDADFRSICRHAAGIFLRHGHRRIGLIIPDFPGAGTLASETGFAEGLAAAGRHGGAEPVVVRHNGTETALASKLDFLFASNRPPTALLIGRSQNVFVVLQYLLKRDLSVPEDVSLIARDQDPLFPHVNPPIAHYYFDPEMFARRLTRLVAQMATGGRVAGRSNLIFPNFYPGRSVANLSAELAR